MNEAYKNYLKDREERKKGEEESPVDDLQRWWLHHESKSQIETDFFGISNMDWEKYISECSAHFHVIIYTLETKTQQ